MRPPQCTSEDVMSKRGNVKFRLYVAGGATNSALALANLTAICRNYLPGRHDIDVIDVFREPKRALDDRIFLTPTLIKLAPVPIRRIVGALSETATVVMALGLKPDAA